MLKQEVNNKIIVFSIISALAVFSFIIIFLSGINPQPSQSEAAAIVPLQIQQQPALQKADQFSDLPVSAKAVYIYDIKEGRVIYEKNSDMPLPLASLTKIMTALVAEESVGDKDPDITIEPQAIAQLGDSGLKVGEKWKFLDLLKFTLMMSSNDGAQQIADAFSSMPFVTMMNEEAKIMNLKTLHFTNPTGLDADDGTSYGGVGSAKEISSLFEYVYYKYPDIFEYTKYATHDFSSNSSTHHAENTDTITDKIPGMLAGKTGFTNAAGGNLIILFNRAPGDPVIMTVLGSTYDGRFSDMLLLASSTLQTYNK